MSNTILLRIILCVAVLNVMTAKAQNTYSGTVVNEDSVGLQFVNVFALSKTDSAVVAATVTDSTGVYRLPIQKGEHIVKYSYLGYETQYLHISPDSDGMLDVVKMTPSAQLLDEVEVTDNRPVFRITGNELHVNVENDGILKRQTNIYDLLGKIPGIIQSGKSIEVIGRGTPVYYINGKKAYDVSEIQNIPVERIKTIKVINGKNVKYDSGSSAVIDIKTKKIGDGLAYNITGNLTAAKYMSPGSMINLGYTNKHWELYLDYSFNREKEKTSNISDLLIYADTLWQKKEHTSTIKSNNNHNYKVGAVYNISADTQWGIQYAGTHTNGNSTDYTNLSMHKNEKEGALLNINTANKERTTTHHLNSYYNSKINSYWDIAVCGDYFHKSGTCNRDVVERDKFLNATETSYKQMSEWDILAMNIQTTRSYESGDELSIGYDLSYTTGDESIDYKTSQLTGYTRNKETKNSLYLYYNKQLGMYSFNMGLRYKFLYSDIFNRLLDVRDIKKRHFILPTFGINHYSGSLMQGLNGSIEVQHPYFSDINDNLSYTNRYSASIGNMQLKTETNYNINYMLMYKFLFLNLGYSYIHNPQLSNFYSDSDRPSVVIGTVSNFSNRHVINCMLNLRHTIKRFTPSLTMVCMKSFFSYPGMDGTTLKDSKPVLLTTAGMDISLPKDYYFSAKYLYNWGGDLQMTTIDKESSLDIAVKKSFYNNRLTISLDAHDIFNGMGNKGRWSMNNLKMSTQSFEDTRKLSLSVVYRFRQKKQSTRSAASNEISRLRIKTEEAE